MIKQATDIIGQKISKNLTKFNRENKIKLMYKKFFFFLLAEILLFAGLFGLFQLQKAQEKGELILRSNMVALFYARPGYVYDRSYRQEFYDFGYPSPSAMFKNPFIIRGGYSFSRANISQFAILLKKDIDVSSDPHIKHAFYYPRANRIQEYDEVLAINLPLYKPGSKTPYGMIRIEHNLKNFSRDVFYKNLLSYILIFIFYNAFLGAIIFALSRKPKPSVIYLEKGYLKDYALGALKLHYKILGQIIEDHEKSTSSQPTEQEAKIIPLEPTDKTEGRKRKWKRRKKS